MLTLCSPTLQIANAVRDAGAAFATEPARASSLLAWAKAGVVRWAELLLADESACAATATLHELAVAARIALAHAALLEPYGLSLGPLLASLLVRPRRRRLSRARAPSDTCLAARPARARVRRARG